MDSFVENNVEALKKRIGSGKVLCALSGGVDSSVLAAMLAKAIGKQLTCVFVDHGLLRKNEKEEVCSVFGPGNANGFDINFICVDAPRPLLQQAEGASPSRSASARSSAKSSSACSRKRRKKSDGSRFILRSTAAIYPRRHRERTRGEREDKEPSQRGRLPSVVDFKEIVEPLRDLFKDEVRKVRL